MAEYGPIAVCTRIDHLDDVRVGQQGGEACFPEQAARPLRIHVAKKLHRDQTLHPPRRFEASEIDVPHPATAEMSNQSVSLDTFLHGIRARLRSRVEARAPGAHPSDMLLQEAR